MKVLFKNKTKYTKEMYKEFLEFHEEKYGTTYYIYTIIFILSFVFCIVMQLKYANYLLALITAIYVLLSKEKLMLQFKKILFAYFNKEIVDRILFILPSQAKSYSPLIWFLIDTIGINNILEHLSNSLINVFLISIFSFNFIRIPF